MAALSRFISRLSEKGLPFFKLLKATERFSWSEEADTAFEQLKLFLTKPLIMTVPQPDETLLIYIAATSRVVSTAIVVDRVVGQSGDDRTRLIRRTPASGWLHSVHGCCSCGTTLNAARRILMVETVSAHHLKIDRTHKRMTGCTTTASAPMRARASVAEIRLRA